MDVEWLIFMLSSEHVGVSILGLYMELISTTDIQSSNIHHFTADNKDNSLSSNFSSFFWTHSSFSIQYHRFSEQKINSVMKGIKPYRMVKTI